MPGAGEWMTALRTLKLDEFRIGNEHARKMFIRLVSPQVRTLIVHSLKFVNGTTTAGATALAPEFKSLEKPCLTGSICSDNCRAPLVEKVKNSKMKIMSITVEKENTKLMENLSFSSVPNFDLEEITLQTLRRGAEVTDETFSDPFVWDPRFLSFCKLLQRLNPDGRYSNLTSEIQRRIPDQVGLGLDNTYRTALTPQVLQNIMPFAITLVTLRLVDSKTLHINDSDVIPWLNKILRGFFESPSSGLNFLSATSDWEISNGIGVSQDHQGQGNQPAAVQAGVILAGAVHAEAFQAEAFQAEAVQPGAVPIGVVPVGVVPVGVVRAMDWQGERPFLEKIEIRLAHALVQFGVHNTEAELKRWFCFLQKLDARPAPGA